jgi:hypothetical protein
MNRSWVNTNFGLEKYINPLAPNVRYTHRVVWCSKRWMTDIVGGLSWPLLCSPCLNSSLLHITRHLWCQKVKHNESVSACSMHGDMCKTSLCWLLWLLSANFTCLWGLENKRWCITSLYMHWNSEYYFLFLELVTYCHSSFPWWQYELLKFMV